MIYGAQEIIRTWQSTKVLDSWNYKGRGGVYARTCVHAGFRGGNTVDTTTNLEVAPCHADEHKGPLSGLDLPPQKVVQQPATSFRRSRPPVHETKDRREVKTTPTKEKNGAPTTPKRELNG